MCDALCATEKLNFIRPDTSETYMMTVYNIAIMSNKTKIIPSNMHGKPLVYILK